MATPQEKLAQSLEALKKLQEKRHSVAIKSSELSRTHRDRLLQNGFIKKVIDGWYISTPPEEREGDSTSWYSSFWPFCANYLQERYGNDYCLSADQSLQIHAGNWQVPHQLIVRTLAGSNKTTELLHGTSIYSLKSSLPGEAEIVVRDGLRLVSLPAALIHCSPVMFTKHPGDVRAALALIRDPSEILIPLLEGGHSTIAGRLAGAYRNIGRVRFAEEIIKAMQAAGYDVRETDPFEAETPVELLSGERSPQVNRIRLMWHNMRETIIDHFPKAPDILQDKSEYIKAVEELFVTDAYHSLSIERYRVSPELIERVKSGAWNPEEYEADKRQRDAMAARGYWQASQRVMESLERVLDGENAGVVVEQDHGDWYRALFAPSVTSGILNASDLAGYRNSQVYIGKSKHVPMSKEAVRDAMPAFFELLKQEEHAGVRAVLGHFVLVFIHPYMDGNGRMARFLMNVMLVSGGYPWTVIPVEERDPYMHALEAASVEQDIKPFTKFLAWLVEEGMQGRPVAKA